MVGQRRQFKLLPSLIRHITETLFLCTSYSAVLGKIRVIQQGRHSFGQGVVAEVSTLLLVCRGNWWLITVPAMLTISYRLEESPFSILLSSFGAWPSCCAHHLPNFHGPAAVGFTMRLSCCYAPWTSWANAFLLCVRRVVVVLVQRSGFGTRSRPSAAEQHRTWLAAVRVGLPGGLTPLLASRPVAHQRSSAPLLRLYPAISAN